MTDGISLLRQVPIDGHIPYVWLLLFTKVTFVSEGDTQRRKEDTYVKQIRTNYRETIRTTLTGVTWKKNLFISDYFCPHLVTQVFITRAFTYSCTSRTP